MWLRYIVGGRGGGQKDNDREHLMRIKMDDSEYSRDWILKILSLYPQQSRILFLSFSTCLDLKPRRNRVTGGDLMRI
jgi:hypothetical protein